MDKFQPKQMKKIKPNKNTWYDWWINYISEPIRKSIGGLKDKMARLFKTNTSKQITYGRGKKLSKPKTQNKINNIKNPFILKRKNKLKVFRTLFATEEEKEIKKLGKKETNYRLIKGKIAKDIRTLFEQQEEKDYYKLKRVNIFWSNNYIE